MRYTLGKLPKKDDERNLQFADYVRAITPPPSFSFEKDVLSREYFPLLDQGNLPACTVYSAATGQLRFEWREQSGIVSFPRDELKRKYRKIEQPGGGAYLLDLNNLWRKEGFIGCTKRRSYSNCGLQKLLARRRRTCIPYRIDGYQEVKTSAYELKLASYIFGILEIGILVTESFVNSYPDPAPPEAAKEPVLGGHAMCMIGYDQGGIVVRHTWRGHYSPQVVSWGYCLSRSPYLNVTMLDEAYGIVDAKNPKQIRLLNLARFFDDLQNVAGRG